MISTSNAACPQQVRTDPSVTVIIPAHNEAGVITEAITSLYGQQHRPDRIVVVADNCTDDTTAMAIAAGATVITTRDNAHKKAGALNQALARLMPEFDDHDLVLIMDADTTVEPDFITVGLQTLATESRAAGVSSIFVGRPARTLLGEFQRMEYFRYRREIKRHGEQAFVMSGTASLFRVSALRAVRAHRDGSTLPDGNGYYDVYSLTEDNELTLALKTLDYSCPAPGVQSVTDVMETLRTLYQQRHRWFLGALRNLRNYGLKLPRHLRWVYWTQQLGLVLSVITVSMMILLLVLGLSLGMTWHFQLLWFVPTLVPFCERVITVWPMGWRQRLIAGLVLPEMGYAVLLIFTFCRALIDFLRGHRGAWHAT